MPELTNKQLFIQALIEADNRFLEKIPKESECDIEPSERFEIKVRKLIRNQKHSYWKHINNAGKRAAAIVLLIVTLFGTMMSVKAIREPVINFFIETWDTFTHLFTQETLSPVLSEIKMENIFTFDQLPSGFAEFIHNNVDDLSSLTVWRNESEEEIILSQNLKSVDINIDTEKTELHEIQIKGQPAYAYSNKGTISIVWSEQGYSFTLSFPEHLNFDEMKALIEGHLIEKNNN